MERDKFREASFEERVELLKELTSDEKLELMMDYGDWSETSKERVVAHYIMLCEELPKLYIGITGSMSYNSYSPEQEVLPQVSNYNISKSNLADTLSDYDKDVNGLLKWLHEEVSEFSIIKDGK